MNGKISKLTSLFNLPFHARPFLMFETYSPSHLLNSSKCRQLSTPGCQFFLLTVFRNATEFVSIISYLFLMAVFCAGLHERDEELFKCFFDISVLKNYLTFTGDMADLDFQ